MAQHVKRIWFALRNFPQRSIRIGELTQEELWAYTSNNDKHELEVPVIIIYLNSVLRLYR